MLKLGKLVLGNQKARVFFISCRKIRKTDFLPYCNRILRNFVSTKKKKHGKTNGIFTFCLLFLYVTSYLVFVTTFPLLHLSSVDSFQRL